MESFDHIEVGGGAAALPAARLSQNPDRRVQESASEEARGFIAGERLRIARELHDVVSFSLATISVQAGVAAHVRVSLPNRGQS